MKLSSVIVRVGLGVALAAGGGACASRQVAEPAPAPAPLRDYYPLSVGNHWTYQVDGRADKTVKVEVLSETGEYFLDSRGGELRVDAFGIRDRKRYLLREPLVVGSGWTNVVSVSSTERYQIVQVGVPCKAPAGTFQNCVQIEGRNRVDEKITLVNALTFAPGVGLVRVEVAAETGGQRVPQTRLELSSYHLQPAGG